MVSTLSKDRRARELLHKGEPKEAAILFQELSTEAASELGLDDDRTLSIRDNAAKCLQEAKDYEAALAMDEETLRLRRSKSSSPSAAICDTLQRIAANYRDRKNFKRSINRNQEVLLLLKSVPAGQGPDPWSVQYDISCSLNELHKYDQAAELDKKTLREMESNLRKDDWRLTRCREHLAIDLYSLGWSEKLRPPDKIKKWQEAIKLLDTNLVVFQESRGETESDKVRHKEWLDACREAIRACQQKIADHSKASQSLDGQRQEQSGDLSRSSNIPSGSNSGPTLTDDVGKKDSSNQRKNKQRSKETEVEERISKETNGASESEPAKVPNIRGERECGTGPTSVSDGPKWSVSSHPVNLKSKVADDAQSLPCKEKGQRTQSFTKTTGDKNKNNTERPRPATDNLLSVPTSTEHITKVRSNPDLRTTASELGTNANNNQQAAKRSGSSSGGIPGNRENEEGRKSSGGSGKPKPSAESQGTTPARRSGNRRKLVSLLDNKSSGDPARGPEADEWFNLLTDTTHELFDKEKKRKDMGIKIAILDTGIDGTHKRFIAQRRRIQAYKSWIAPTASHGLERGKIFHRQLMENEFKDDNGHGTHSAALLLEVDPWANIYIARIAQTVENGTEINPEHVAQAILYATQKWKVDIITMSFGWPVRPIGYQKIEGAINQALENKILVFAAASNTGANTTIGPAFPANYDRVFCVNSATGYGSRSAFNPPPRQGQGFMTLGEGVNSAWPEHPKEGPGKRQSGTSVATPIAAGIAALVLEFAQQQLPHEKWAKAIEIMKEVSGMHVMFDLMTSETRDGFSYVIPWTLLSGHSANANDVKKASSKIMNSLEDHYPLDE